MKPSRYPTDHPNYGQELEAELQPVMIDIVDSVVAAGCSKDAVRTALISLVADLEHSTFATSETDKLVAVVISLLDNFR